MTGLRLIVSNIFTVLNFIFTVAGVLFHESAHIIMCLILAPTKIADMQVNVGDYDRNIKYHGYLQHDSTNNISIILIAAAPLIFTEVLLILAIIHHQWWFVIYVFAYPELFIPSVSDLEIIEKHSTILKNKFWMWKAKRSGSVHAMLSESIRQRYNHVSFFLRADTNSKSRLTIELTKQSLVQGRRRRRKIRTKPVELL